MNTDSFYRLTLRRAWGFTKRHKKFWILGFLAALLGNGGEYEFFLNKYSDISQGSWNINGGILAALGSSGQNVWMIFEKILQNLPLAAYAVVFFIVILIIILFWLSVSAQGALFSAVFETEEPGKTGEVKLGRVFRTGRESFWSLLGIIIASRLSALFITAVVGLPLLAILVALNENWVPLGLIFVVFVLGMPLLALFSLISKLAIAYQMSEKKGMQSSFASALVLFGEHWLVTVEVALVLFLINIIAGFVFVLGIMLLALPFLLLGSFFSQSSQWLFVGLTAEIGIVLFLIILAFFGSALSTFQNSSWAMLFLKIRNQRHTSKLVRIIHGWREKYG